MILGTDEFVDDVFAAVVTYLLNGSDRDSTRPKNVVYFHNDNDGKDYRLAVEEVMREDEHQSKRNNMGDKPSL